MCVGVTLSVEKLPRVGEGVATTARFLSSLGLGILAHCILSGFKSEHISTLTPRPLLGTPSQLRKKAPPRNTSSLHIILQFSAQISLPERRVSWEAKKELRNG